MMKSLKKAPQPIATAANLSKLQDYDIRERWGYTRNATRCDRRDSII